MWRYRCFCKLPLTHGDYGNLWALRQGGASSSKKNSYLAGTKLQVEGGTDDRNDKTSLGSGMVLGYPILRRSELELFDLCPKAAGTSGISGPWPCGSPGPLSHGSGEVVCLLHDPVWVSERYGLEQ